jgi:predicted phosphoribosyltransferase
VPVAPLETCEAFRSEVEEVICGITPEPVHCGRGLVFRFFTNER